MRTSMLWLAAAAALAGCNQSTDEAAPKPAPKKEKTPYCFFKEPDTKAWAASTDSQGNVVVKGKAYRSDPRYMAVLGAAKVTGTSAEVRPSITVNNTGYAAPGGDNWWDVSATIPNSAAVTDVQVRCGKKVLADLKVPRKA